MATPEGTHGYFQRLNYKGIPANSIRTLGKTGLKVCGIGFGGYRIHADSGEHARALRYALLNGFNLIDTSSNYGDGGSELLIGNLLEEMIIRDEIKRDEIVLVSKVGYVQGQNLRIVQEAKDEGRPFREVVEYANGCWHCIHPEFLEDQFSRTLERLNVLSLDVYLLHNPEYFLMHAKKEKDADLQAVRTEYHRRIKAAFEWLEEKVAEGRIRSYGISSNSFVDARNSPDFTSLEICLQLAREVSPHHFFQVIQFPFNLFEPGAALVPNQSGGKTLLELAGAEGLGTLANRPLNSMRRSGFIRLADFRVTDVNQNTVDFQEGLATLAEHEMIFKNQLVKDLPSDIPQEQALAVFSLSEQLGNALTFFQGWEHWDHARQNVIIPQTFSALNYLNSKLEKNDEWRGWANVYSKLLLSFLDTITRHYENQAQKTSKEIAAQLDRLNPYLSKLETLSQKALKVSTSVHGLDCVLLGMRRISYVEDAFAAILKADIKDTAGLLRSLNAKK
jgi:aryl-alcohol dehydrogenase-like predicted oxidoreductase